MTIMTAEMLLGLLRRAVDDAIAHQELRAGREKFVSEAEKDRMVEMKLSGATSVHIGLTLGRSERTVVRILRQRGIATNRIGQGYRKRPSGVQARQDRALRLIH